MKRRVLLLPALAAALAGCGYIGDPLPPALDIPLSVTDLRAAEYGDTISVAFTVPDRTTEGLALTKVRAIELYLNETKIESPRRVPGEVTFDVPAAAWAGQSVVVRARAIGPKGRASDWSNAVTLAVIPPLAAPAGVKVEDVAQGVRISWQGSAPRYRVFRATDAAEPQALADTRETSYVDTTSIYGMHYRYRVQSLAEETQQSVVTEPMEITPVDTFAPAVPQGVIAIATARAIELAWARNTEDDFASYNIYRAEGDGALVRIAAGIEAPTYSDAMVEVGKTYRYAITAVDQKGNESGQSERVEAATR